MTRVPSSMKIWVGGDEAVSHTVNEGGTRYGKVETASSRIAAGDLANASIAQDLLGI
jgi:hypothetical protein